jgi:hypothetical protein
MTPSISEEAPDQSEIMKVAWQLRQEALADGFDILLVPVEQTELITEIVCARGWSGGVEIPLSPSSEGSLETGLVFFFLPVGISKNLRAYLHQPYLTGCWEDPLRSSTVDRIQMVRAIWARSIKPQQRLRARDRRPPYQRPPDPQVAGSDPELR